MTTIGLIGAGHIGSQVARLAVAQRLQRRDQQFARAGDADRRSSPSSGRRRAPRRAVDAAKAGDIVVVTVPLKNYRTVPVEPLAGKIVIDTNNYYPQRDGHIRRARQRVDDHGRAAAGAPADVEGRQGVQSHLRRAAHDRRPAGGHAEPSRAGHRRRRSRRQGDGHAPARPVRLRHGRCGSAEGGLAHPARYARATVRAAPPRSCARISPRPSGTPIAVDVPVELGRVDSWLGAAATIADSVSVSSVQNCGRVRPRHRGIGGCSSGVPRIAP